MMQTYAYFAEVFSQKDEVFFTSAMIPTVKNIDKCIRKLEEQQETMLRLKQDIYLIRQMGKDRVTFANAL